MASMDGSQRCNPGGRLKGSLQPACNLGFARDSPRADHFPVDHQPRRAQNRVFEDFFVVGDLLEFGLDAEILDHFSRLRLEPLAVGASPAKYFDVQHIPSRLDTKWIPYSGWFAGLARAWLHFGHGHASPSPRGLSAPGVSP